MEKTTVADATPTTGTSSVTRSLADTLGVESFEWNYFEVEPGEQFSVCYHAHPDEEELFYVLEGRATFDTEDGAIHLGSNEALRFAPGEFQHGYNDTDETVRALAFSAPKDPELSGIIECPECGERETPEKKAVDDGSATIILCAACGAAVERID